MEQFVIGAIVVIVLWVIISLRSKNRTNEAFNVRDEAETWFNSEGIQSTSVKFSVYDDPKLVKNIGATVLVGYGHNKEGNNVGFVLEVKPSEGVLEGAFLEPIGIVSNHRTAAQAAKVNGMSLFDALQEKARQHQIKHNT